MRCRCIDKARQQGNHVIIEVRDEKGNVVLTQDLEPVTERLSRPALRLAGLKEGEFATVATLIFVPVVFSLAHKRVPETHSEPSESPAHV